MSIIHDALKKVQSKHPEMSASEQPQPTGPSAQPQAAPVLTHADTKHSLTILMSAVLAVAVIVIFAVIFKLAADTTQHVKPTPAATLNQTPTTAPQPVTPPAPAPAPTVVPPVQAKPTTPPAPVNNGLHIEGVMDMGGKMVALINGNIYEEGQAVNGNIIAVITFESVTIMENGVKKILSTKP